MAIYQEKPKLSRLSIKGFKSIRDLDNFSPKAINVFIGNNGVGKSNLLNFFKLLSWTSRAPSSFQDYIYKLGRASGIMFNGTKTTNTIEGEISIETNSHLKYNFKLSVVGAEELVFSAEKIKINNDDWISLGKGHSESKLFEQRTENEIIKNISIFLESIRVFQFHDTGENSEIRHAWNANDGLKLLEKGQNLGSYLYNLKLTNSRNYLNLVEQIRQVFPDFQDFVLVPLGDKIELKWKEKNSEYVYSAFQASDGTLRFWCLVALFSQAYQDLPAILFIDEPELGLHPEAISFFAGLVKKASAFSQVFISTQSPELVNQFSANDVIVVEKENKESTFKRLQEDELKNWLASYSLSELWRLNLLRA